MRKIVFFGFLFTVAALTLAGCSNNDPAAEATSNGAPTGGGEKLLLASEPAGAKGVIEIKKQAKDGEEVVVVGRIGGSKEPFIKDRASFTIVDTSFVSCDEMEGWKDYPTPWEFC